MRFPVEMLYADAVGGRAKEVAQVLMRWESSIVVSCGRVELMGDGG